MKLLLENWRKQLLQMPNETKKLSLREHQEILNEISKQAADKIYDWMASAGTEDYSFNDLFNGQMRVAIPLVSQDEENLRKVVFALREEGWSTQGIPFKIDIVKQKKKRLGTGEEYESAEEVARLIVHKETERIIPKGPRAGEKTVKKENTTMSRAINKSKNIPEDLKNWWQNKQTFYTKERNHKKIETFFDRGKSEADFGADQTVILSRHPIDVLRMSDIGSITSCHSEGNSYFQCAVAEAKGHGPIAYLVPTKELKAFLAGSAPAEDTDEPYLGMDYYREELESLEPEAKEFIENYVRTQINYSEGSTLDQLLKGNFPKQRIKDVISIIHGNAGKREDFRSAKDRGETWVNDVTPAAMEQCLAALVKGEDWDPKMAPAEEADISTIGEFDDEEIFRDSNRSIPGIGATTRVRLRKFHDDEGNFFFAVPERRSYGKTIPGFVTAISKWAFESQKRLFLGDDGETVVPPDFYNLSRYGGTYEDNKDGQILNKFFAVGAGLEPIYNASLNVNSESDEEDEQDALYEQYQTQVEELLNLAGNSLEHCSVYAEVEYGDDQPYVYGSANFSIEFPKSLFGAEAGAEYEMPETWSAINAMFDEFQDHARTEFNLYLYWEDADLDATDDEYRFNFTIPWDDYEATPEGLSGLIAYMESDFDSEYSSIRAAFRSYLVSEQYMAEAPFDLFRRELEPEDEDAPEYTHWDYDVEAGEIDFQLKSREERYRTSNFKGVLLGRITNIGSEYGQQSLESLFPLMRREVAPSFNLSFFKKLQGIEAAARAAAQKQLTLPGIEPEIIKELNFPNLMKLRMRARAAVPAKMAMDIYLDPLLTIDADIEEEELNAVKAFVDHLDEDRNMDVFIKAARDTFNEFYEPYKKQNEDRRTIKSAANNILNKMKELTIEQIMVFSNQFLEVNKFARGGITNPYLGQKVSGGADEFADEYRMVWPKIKQVQEKYPEFKILDLTFAELEKLAIHMEDKGFLPDELAKKLAEKDPTFDRASEAAMVAQRLTTADGRPMTANEYFYYDIDNIITRLRKVITNAGFYIAAAAIDPKVSLHIEHIKDIPPSIQSVVDFVQDITRVDENIAKTKQNLIVRIKRQ